MNIQPNSNQLRKYIPQQDYFRMMEEQRRRSYIGISLNSWDKKRINQRVEELESLEKSGFVYVGEKNWLQSYLHDHNSSQFQDYHQWVNYNFKNYLGLHFEISQGFSHLDYTIWQAELKTDGLLLDFEELRNPAFLRIDNLEIYIGGSGLNPHEAYLAKAFEFLHNLEYAIATLLYDPKGSRALSITGIDVSNPVDPCRWELNVISDYGSEWDFTILNGIAWQ